MPVTAGNPPACQLNPDSVTTMQEIDRTEFAWKLRVRPQRVDDYESVVELQHAAFPDTKPWAQDQFESQLTLFPEGQIGVECDGQLVASSSSLVLSYYDQADWHDYKKLSDSGYIRNHKPDRDTLYGIEIMVHPEFRGMRLSRRLDGARTALCPQLNLEHIMIGGRIPDQKQHASKLSAREHVERCLQRRR